jgi:hypothetical protein
MWFFAVHVHNNAHCIIETNCLMRRSFIKSAATATNNTGDIKNDKKADDIADNLLIYGKTGIDDNLMHLIM